MYQPEPIDTSKVSLPQSLEELLELLSYNTHEVWAQQRLNDGWTYGAERDDAKKLHPCLVPYDNLAESEKVYDRNTAREVLKVILASGFKIEKI
ncbi:RyR domain-containing protein [uncultured Thiothrix sp.]|uniref:RyR domain-containing protein n=1 Tax=uncultured Thiothrix sp. TaxID=223185 RepID=UPI002637A3BE|nr:RyR domain-containing protein [uncultured Thiothrix sp.]HMT91934.1 RyR domain-containing protein [Thiolinea sp.]